MPAPQRPRQPRSTCLNLALQGFRATSSPASVSVPVDAAARRGLRMACRLARAALTLRRAALRRKAGRVIAGIGVDMVSIPRFAQLMERRGRRGARAASSPRARRSGAARPSPPLESFAGRFAAKEAFFKALGTGWGLGGRWTEVEVVSAPSGAPVAAPDRPRGGGRRRARRRPHPPLHHPHGRHGRGLRGAGELKAVRRYGSTKVRNACVPVPSYFRTLRTLVLLSRASPRSLPDSVGSILSTALWYALAAAAANLIGGFVITAASAAGRATQRFLIAFGAGFMIATALVGMIPHAMERRRIRRRWPCWWATCSCTLRSTCWSRTSTLAKKRTRSTWSAAGWASPRSAGCCCTPSSTAWPSPAAFTWATGWGCSSSSPSCCTRCRRASPWRPSCSPAATRAKRAIGAVALLGV